MCFSGILSRVYTHGSNEGSRTSSVLYSVDARVRASPRIAGPIRNFIMVALFFASWLPVVIVVELAT